MKNFISCLLVAMLFLYGCSPQKEIETISPITETQKYSADVANQWAEMTLSTIYQAPANSPTYCSRAMGYMGLTMYESVVHGSTEHKSLVGQLNGLYYLPSFIPGQKYNWNLSLNASQAFMLKKLYPQVDESKIMAIDVLENKIYAEYSKNESKEVVDRSVEFGLLVAKAIYYGWAINDGGHDGYLRSFSPDYMLPYTVGTWRAPIIGQTSSTLPLHPYWGKNRTFSKENGLIPVPTMIEYSPNRNSEYFKIHQEVYEKNNTLTQSEKDIAVWWGDDPSETHSPPGHSYYLANIAIKTSRADLFKATETYARVGMAVADAFINCWKAKYTYICERPTTFIRANIDFSWLPFWPEPPFPAFSSGHATQASATAAVLTDLYGSSFKFTDELHVGRPDDIRGASYNARKFNSFQEAAEESAYSRFLGGIHTQQDNNVGLVEGKKIGQNINNLKWKK